MQYLSLGNLNMQNCADDKVLDEELNSALLESINYFTTVAPHQLQPSSRAAGRDMSYY